jgi:hypothetical protein
MIGMIQMKLILLIWLIVFLPFVFACGVTTHTIIGKNALEMFHHPYKDLILEHANIFYASLMFPDWGYNCFLDEETLRNASEVAHWLPFQKEGIKYLHDTYSFPWNKDAEKLVVFLMGVMSHSVADIIWHDLGIINDIGQGFIQAMANIDFGFNGQPYDNDLHALADIGGEFMIILQYDQDYPINFSLPLDDIVAIYKRLGININTDQIVLCMDEIYSEIIFMRSLDAEIYYPILSSLSLFLVDYFRDWWLGGMDSLSTWTSYCWNNLANMINGTIMMPCFIYNVPYQTYYNPDYYQLKDHLNKKFLNANSSKYYPYEKCRQTEMTVFHTNHAYAYLGSSLAMGDVNGDGKKEIMIGAPGMNHNGGVFIIYYNTSWEKNILLDGNPNVQLLSYRSNTSFYHRFGESIVCLDVNLDGLDDLVVGIPGKYNDLLFETRGEIQIYFGGVNGISLIPNVTIKIYMTYSNMGMKMKIDNNKLIIQNYLANLMNPEEGQIIILTPSSDLLHEKEIICYYNKCNSPIMQVMIFPNNSWGWNGFQITYWKNNWIISEPLYHNSGRIYLYSQKGIIWQIYSSCNQSRFGFDFLIMNDFIFISSLQTLEEPFRGAVYYISLSKLVPGSYNILEIMDGSFYSSSLNSHYGWVMKSVNNDIFIGEPNYDVNRGAINSLSSSQCYTVPSKKGHFGKTIETTPYGLLVGAPDSLYGTKELSGSVYLWPLV